MLPLVLVALIRWTGGSTHTHTHTHTHTLCMLPLVLGALIRWTGCSSREELEEVSERTDDHAAAAALQIGEWAFSQVPQVFSLNMFCDLCLFCVFQL